MNPRRPCQNDSKKEEISQFHAHIESLVAEDNRSCEYSVAGAGLRRQISQRRTGLRPRSSAFFASDRIAAWRFNITSGALPRALRPAQIALPALSAGSPELSTGCQRRGRSRRSTRPPPAPPPQVVETSAARRRVSILRQRAQAATRVRCAFEGVLPQRSGRSPLAPPKTR